MAVIELDPSPETPLTPARPPLHIFRPAGLVVAAVLLLALGGAAPAATTMWRSIGSIPLATEGTFTPAGDRIVTLADTDQARVLTAWQQDPPRRLWTASLPASEPPDGVVLTAGNWLFAEGDTLMVPQSDYSTVAVDLRSGQTRYTLRNRVEPALPGVGLIRRTIFRPGAANDPGSDADGMLHIGDDGRPYHEPPQRTEVSGIDLGTGRALWRLPVRGAAVTRMVGASLLVVSDDRLQEVDATTGRVLREQESAGGGWVDIVGGLAVVFGARTTTAYDLATLTPRWHTPTGPLSDTATGARCDGVVCRRSETGAEVIDPATGATRWRTGREASLRPQGSSLIEYDSVSQRPLRVVDAASGRPAADLRSWQTLSSLGTLETLLSRVEPGGKRMSFAVVRAGQIQPLGYADVIVRDCRAGDGLVVCRHDEGIELFAYRA
ncbi:PQQ-binding-like beta-propeller repeat protein [Actinoplanes sp. NPDC089786]|uniref:outer membrane protein assembly factor BamB family protein n=1 Tax=Actinoplanes sp. NPDC089786 TaxID=3155185 RepID=UPI0034200FEC